MHDLPAADDIYLHQCYRNFKTNKSFKPYSIKRNEPDIKRFKGCVSSKKETFPNVISNDTFDKIKGRKENEEQKNAFLEVAKYLKENIDEQLTVNDLINMMENILIDSPSSAYSYRHMDRKLREHFGDSIVFTSLPRKIQVVTFIQKASTVLHEFYHGNWVTQDPEEEKARLIKTAAELIRDDIN